MRVGGVGRDSQVIQSVDGFKAVQTFSHEDEIGMESGNLLQAWIDCAADLGFFLGIGRVVAEFRVADETVLHAESIDRFGEAWSQGHDTAKRLRNAHRAAGFIGDFTVDRRGGRRMESTLRAGGRCAEQQSSRSKNHSSQKLVG